MRLTRFPIVILTLTLISCGSTLVDQNSTHTNESVNDKKVFEAASEFASMVLGNRLRTTFTEYKRGNIGVDALYEADDFIGYTTFSNEIYQKGGDPNDVEGCVLFAGEFKDAASAKWAFDHLKANSAVQASEVEGMVGILPVQVRFLEQFLTTGAFFAQKGNYFFFLTENCNTPPLGASWLEYENLFLTMIGNEGEVIEVINADCDGDEFRIESRRAKR